MASQMTVSRREHAELALDACLITAGLFALAASIAFGIVAVFVGVAAPTWLLAVAQVTGSLLMLAIGILGPYAAWRLHGRHFTAVAILGALVGAGVAGLVTAGAALLSIPLAWLVSPISTSEFAGPIVLLGITATAFLVGMVWLLVDAARDSRPTRRTHERLDGARLLSALAVVALAVVSTWLTVASPAGEAGEAIIFALVFGISGGAMVVGADVLTALAERGKSSPAGEQPT